MGKDALKDMVTTLFSGEIVGPIVDILTRNFAKDWLGQMQGIIETFLIPLGMTMVLIYFLMEVVDHLQFNPTTFEFLLKSFIKLFVGLYVVGNCIQIFIDLNTAGITLTNNVITKIIGNDGGGVSSGKVNTKAMISLIDKSNTATRIGYLAWLMIAMIIMLGIKLLINFIMYSRLLKQYLMATFAPIALSDTISGGFNSRGFKYIKQYLALCLQGLIILITVYASSTVIKYINGGGELTAKFTIEFFAAYLISQLVVAASIMKSEQIAKEIIGA